MIEPTSSAYSVDFMNTHGVVLLREELSGVIVGTPEELSSQLRRTLQAFHLGAVRTQRIDKGDLRLRIQRHVALQSPVRRSRGAKVVALSETSTDAPAVNLVNSILSEAARHRASDLYLTRGENEISIRARIDGTIHTLAVYDAAHFRALSARLKILSGLNGSERRRPQDGRFTADLDGDRFDVRLSAIPTAAGESLALRLFPQASRTLHLSELGLSATQERVLAGAITKGSGLVLVSGPTGSGKTTTLHACIRSIDSSRRRVVTIEDPVEYRLPGVEQVQVSESAGISFEAALRRILRHDPDVIMVGEVRDTETAKLVVRAALTGHLVLSTLHSDCALGAIRRLVNLGADCSLLHAMPVVLMAQRLVRVVCDACGAERPPREEDVVWFHSHDESAPVAVRHGPGCDRCVRTGYLGRTAIFELVSGSGTDWLSSGLISSGLIQSGLDKVRRGISTAEEVAWAIGE